MSFFIPNTICKICNSPIVEAKDSLVLDYVNVTDHPDLRPFVKSFVHRSCYADWELRDQYSQAAFELVKGAIERGDVRNAIYAEAQLLILQFDDWLFVKDFSIVFELEIPHRERTVFLQQLAAFLNGETATLRFGHWHFDYLNEELIVVKTYSTDAVSDEFTLPKGRLQELVAAIQSVTQNEHS